MPDLIRRRNVLPIVAEPIRVIATTYGNGSGCHTMLACRWRTTQGKACRRCPAGECTLSHGDDGESMCQVKFRGDMEAASAWFWATLAPSSGFG